MIEVLAAIGLFILWLISPLVMMVLFKNCSGTPGELVCIVYVGGVLFVGYALVNFIGIW